MKKLKVPRPEVSIRRTPEAALRSVQSKTGLGVFASADQLYKNAVFGRDSLEVAEDLMDVKPKLVREILLAMARLHGEVYDRTSEEEPGKIVHEYRSLNIDGTEIDDVSKQILGRLSQRWGGTEEELAYYGSVDATPLFIKTLANYCLEYGDQILLERIVDRRGKNVSVLDVLEGACWWLARALERSRSGLLEYKRLNPHGIANQAWKDSLEAYVHDSGQLANHNAPIASVEVQALAYDALSLATRLLPTKRLYSRARHLRDQTINKLWSEQQQYFYLALDRDDKGKERQVRTITANAAEMLNSSVFDELSMADKQKFIGGIVKKIMSPDFLTDAGIRSRALSDAHLISHWDYHGSFVTWPKETYDIAKGLRRQGFPVLAAELENRLLNLVKASQSFPEFVYVDELGRVLGLAKSSTDHGDFMFLIEGSNQPEKVQAWTVSAILAIRRTRKSIQSARRSGWQKTLEDQIIAKIPHVPELTSRKALTARYPFYPYELSRSQ